MSVPKKSITKTGVSEEQLNAIAEEKKLLDYDINGAVDNIAVTLQNIQSHLRVLQFFTLSL